MVLLVVAVVALVQLTMSTNCFQMRTKVPSNSLRKNQLQFHRRTTPTLNKAFIAAESRHSLQSLHYRACCVITGCVATSHAPSVCYEASFRTFDEVARDEIVKVADRLRRMPDGCKSNSACEQGYGPEWVARLFRDGVMLTAELRPVMTAAGTQAKRAPAVWPCPGWKRQDDDTVPDALHSGEGIALRDVGMRLHYGAPGEHHGRNAPDTRLNDGMLRPLPLVHPWAPHELARFDTHIKFIRSAPGDLKKDEGFPERVTPERLKEFEAANAQRMSELREACGDNAIYIFTDAARSEAMQRNAGAERCAGAFVVCRGQDPRIKDAHIVQEHVPVSPIACVYSGELGAIDAALQYALKHLDSTVFPTKQRDGNAASTPAKRQLVLVTDSKSALESLYTTWTRRIQFLEQKVVRTLYELAKEEVHVTLAFVFSHAGGVPGNEYIDKVAVRARDGKAGCTWTKSIWHEDTTRRILRDHHRIVDTKPELLGHFRFRHMPGNRGPSEPLPRDMPRSHEKLLYRARLGMVVEAGGVLHHHDGALDPCPLCEQPALGRNGATLLHLFKCAPECCSRTPLLAAGRLRPGQLWKEPAEAVQSLRLITAVIRSTPLGAERAAAALAAHKRTASNGAKR